MEKFLSFALFLGIFGGACSTAPELVHEPAAAVEEAPAPVIPEDVPEESVPEDLPEESLNSEVVVTEEEFNFTKAEIQALVEKINTIIQSKDYNAWINCLGAEYLAEKNSKTYLAQISEQPRLKSQKITLANAEDYFNHVVVPSRVNNRVDDIEFVTKNRVKAYTLKANGQRLRLYDLENLGNGWKIIN
ncbi:MAG: hypothetical protein LBP42_03885 [Treponema sp.]|jgi:Txe/YoeB family toxin of Txe-Axe toxin-antitoxin module|nr:hypothetical protein [Treponema sp.]